MDSKISTEYDNRPRRLFKIKCDYCKNDVWKPKHALRNNNYCSIVCRARAREHKIESKCSTCGKIISRTPSQIKRSKSGLLFCDRSCKEYAQGLESGIAAIQPYHYGSAGGLYSYRDKALKYRKFCEICGYSEEIRMLDVHHRDGNRRNNKLANLQVLCVWDHALITRGLL
jgi:hypothetical protein